MKKKIPPLSLFLCLDEMHSEFLIRYRLAVTRLPVPHSLTKFGARFSANAVMPSFRSFCNSTKWNSTINFRLFTPSLAFVDSRHLPLRMWHGTFFVRTSVLRAALSRRPYSLLLCTIAQSAVSACRFSRPIESPSRPIGRPATLCWLTQFSRPHLHRSCCPSGTFPLLLIYRWCASIAECRQLLESFPMQFPVARISLCRPHKWCRTSLPVRSLRPTHTHWPRQSLASGIAPHASNRSGNSSRCTSNTCWAAFPWYRRRPQTPFRCRSKRWPQSYHRPRILPGPLSIPSSNRCTVHSALSADSMWSMRHSSFRRSFQFWCIHTWLRKDWKKKII